MTGFELMRYYKGLEEEQAGLEQVMNNAFMVFSETCPIEDFDKILKIAWQELFNWDESFPQCNSFFIQDEDFIKETFQKVICGEISREEFDSLLYPTYKSIQDYFSQLEYDKDDIEKEVQEELKTCINSIDNLFLRNVLLLAIPYIKDIFIYFLFYNRNT